MARKPTGLAEASVIPAPAPVRLVTRSDPKSRIGKKMVAGWYDRAAVIGPEGTRAPR